MKDNTTHPCTQEDNINIYVFYPMVLMNTMVVGKSIFVIMMTCRVQARQKNFNIVFASMAVNEMILAVASIGYQVSTIPYNKLHIRWSNVVTTFVFGDCYGSILVCLMHMGLIAMDRYVHIVHPIQYMKYATKRCLLWALIVTWTIGLIFIVVPIFIYIDDKYHLECIFFHPPIMYYSFFFSVYLVILVAVFVGYFKIALLAYTRKKAANTRRMNTHVIGSDTIVTANRTSVLRSIKFFDLMFGMFAVYSFPIIIIIWLGYPYRLTENILRISFFVQPIKSMISIFVYIKVNRDFSQVIQSNCCILVRHWINRPDRKYRK